MDKFAALADPTRRRIIELLAGRGELSATEIAHQFPSSPPAISQHLKVLRDANLVVMEKRAQRRIYHLNPAAMSEMDGWIQKMTEQWNDRFSALDQVLEREKRKLGKRSQSK